MQEQTVYPSIMENMVWGGQLEKDNCLSEAGCGCLTVEG
jgi:hypothetical protein